MKILLINPPEENVISEFQDAQGKGFLEASDYGRFPPLGLLYVLSYAQNNFPEHQYYFLDCVGENLSHEALERKTREIAPDLVGMTSFTISLIDVVKAAEAVRRVSPNAHLCLGGHHPTAFPLQAAMLTQFNSIIVGEGEHAFASLIECLDSKHNYDSITGLYTRSTIHFHRTAEQRDPRFRYSLPVPPAYMDDIDALPPPDRSHIQHIKYNSLVGLKSKLATIITSRGCPCKCTFCDVPYKQYRPRNIEAVMDEIEACLRMEYEEFHFYDDLFNITPQRVEEFCQALKARKLNIAWDFRGRVNGVTYESLALAKSLGLRLISFGVETGSNEGLRLLNKGTTVEQIEKVFSWCRKIGIKTIADYMIGLPHERTEADVQKNIDFLIRLAPDYAQIGILNLYPHTQLYNDAIARGLIEPGRWEEWACNPKPGFRVDHWNEFLSEDVLTRLHREAYHRFYFRPGYIFRAALSIRSIHEFRSKIIGALKLLSRG